MSVREKHLGDTVHDYVDGALEADQRLWADRHLLVCPMCREQVVQERALVDSLRSFRPDPHRQQDLMAGLLGLAEGTPSPTPPAPRTLGLVTVDAPPQYESCRQHPVLVALIAVAGCMGVALVVIGVPGRVQGSASGLTPATVRLSPGSAPAAPRLTGGSVVVPAAVARAELDAREAIEATGAQQHRGPLTVRVP